jgi:hypothetical protein
MTCIRLDIQVICVNLMQVTWPDCINQNHENSFIWSKSNKMGKRVPSYNCCIASLIARAYINCKDYHKWLVRLVEEQPFHPFINSFVTEFGCVFTFLSLKSWKVQPQAIQTETNTYTYIYIYIYICIYIDIHIYIYIYT